MEIFSDIKTIPDEAKDCVIAIGNFDGVHQGHKSLIAQARHIADKTNKKLGILTFEPHPRRLFQPDLAPARITPIDLKAEKLAQENIDYLFSAPFDWDFASQTADDFIKNILINGLSANHIIIGYDFKFGQLRGGNADTIQKAGLAVTQIKAQTDDTVPLMAFMPVTYRLKGSKNGEKQRPISVSALCLRCKRGKSKRISSIFLIKISMTKLYVSSSFSACAGRQSSTALRI